MSLLSPLSRAAGRGTARSGADHWWAQRVTAIAMVPLALWFFLSVGSLNIVDHKVVTAWFAEVWHATFSLLLIVNLCFHSYLGVQVVIEDYVGGPLKVLSLILSQFAHIVLAAIGTVAIFRIVFGG